MRFLTTCCHRAPVLALLLTLTTHILPSFSPKREATAVGIYQGRQYNPPQNRYNWLASVDRSFGPATQWGGGVVDETDTSVFYAADKSNHKILKFVNEIQTDSWGSTDGNTDVLINKPSTVCDRVINNQVYFFDEGIMANRKSWLFRRLNLNDGKFYTVAGKDQPVGDAEDGTGTDAVFKQPWHCTFNDDGSTVWVTDSFSHTIRKVILDPNPPFSTNSGVVTTVVGTRGVDGMNTETFSSTGNAVLNSLPSGADVKLNAPRGLRYFKNQATGNEWLFIGSDGKCVVERCSITDGYKCRSLLGSGYCQMADRTEWAPEHEVMTTIWDENHSPFFVRSIIVLGDENRFLLAEVDRINAFQYVPGDGTYRLGPKLRSDPTNGVAPVVGDHTSDWRAGRGPDDIYPTGFSAAGRVKFPDFFTRVGNTNEAYCLSDQGSSTQVWVISWGTSLTMSAATTSESRFPQTLTPSPSSVTATVTGRTASQAKTASQALLQSKTPALILQLPPVPPRASSSLGVSFSSSAGKTTTTSSSYNTVDSSSNDSSSFMYLSSSAQQESAPNAQKNEAAARGDNNEGRLTGAETAGIAVGASFFFLLLVLAVVVGCCCLRSRRNANKKSEEQCSAVPCDEEAQVQCATEAQNPSQSDPFSTNPVENSDEN